MRDKKNENLNYERNINVKLLDVIHLSRARKKINRKTILTFPIRVNLSYIN